MVVVQLTVFGGSGALWHLLLKSGICAKTTNKNVETKTVLCLNDFPKDDHFQTGMCQLIRGHGCFAGINLKKVLAQYSLHRHLSSDQTVFPTLLTLSLHLDRQCRNAVVCSCTVQTIVLFCLKCTAPFHSTATAAAAIFSSFSSNNNSHINLSEYNSVSPLYFPNVYHWPSSRQSFWFRGHLPQMFSASILRSYALITKATEFLVHRISIFIFCVEARYS